MQKRKFLTLHEVSMLLNVISDSGVNSERNHCLILMTFIHGLRATEVLRLRLSDLDLYGKQIQIFRIKNSFSTVHPLISREIQSITNWLRVRRTMVDQENDWLFISRTGQPISRQQFYYILVSASQKADLPLCAHPHMLRHACGYALANNGIDTRLIQDYLGHKNIRHTVRYTASNASRFGGMWQGRTGSRKQQNDPKCKPAHFSFLKHSKKKPFKGNGFFMLLFYNIIFI